MCTYNAISSHTDHFEIQKRDSEESLLTFEDFLEVKVMWRCTVYSYFMNVCSIVKTIP